MKQKYIYLTFILIISASCNTKNNTIEFNPIGTFSSEYTLKTGAPRQGMLKPESKGVIVLDTMYTRGLCCLDEFEYIWVLFSFHHTKNWESLVTPPKSDRSYGVFATRTPCRPNPIGLSLIKIDTIIGHKIYVSGIDLFDETPILDIKPYLPTVDNTVSKKNTEAEIHLGLHRQNFISDSLVNDMFMIEKEH